MIAKSNVDGLIFSPAQACPWFCSFGLGHNHTGFGFTWHGVGDVRWQSPHRQLLPLFSRAWEKGQKKGKAQFSLLGYPVVPMSVSMFSSLPGAGAAPSPHIFEPHFTLWTSLVIVSLRNENSALYLAGNIRNKH